MNLPKLTRATKIVGQKVALCPIEEKEIPLFQRWINDLIVSRYLSRPDIINTFEDEKKWFKKAVKSNDAATFSVVVKRGGKTIGNTSLMKIDKVNGNAELGIMIGDKKYWGRGYGTEATKLMLDFGFNILRLHQIYLKVVAFNKRALKAYRKAGFKLVGRLRESRFFSGEYHDEYLMDVLDREFKSPVVKELLTSTSKRRQK